MCDRGWVVDRLIRESVCGVCAYLSDGLRSRSMLCLSLSDSGSRPPRGPLNSPLFKRSGKHGARSREPLKARQASSPSDGANVVLCW